jgi:hypothetical protein
MDCKERGEEGVDGLFIAWVLKPVLETTKVVALMSDD